MLLFIAKGITLVSQAPLTSTADHRQRADIAASHMVTQLQPRMQFVTWLARILRTTASC